MHDFIVIILHLSNNHYLYIPLHEVWGVTNPSETLGDSKCMFLRLIPLSWSGFFNAGFNGDMWGSASIIGVIPDLRATYDNSMVFNNIGVKLTFFGFGLVGVLEITKNKFCFKKLKEIKL